MITMRVGQGFDVHRFTDDPSRRMVLGGVEFPGERGLAGHSDADVVAHAVVDALLGAAGLGDIGQYFPDTDERWRGADSIDLLREVAGCSRLPGGRKRADSTLSEDSRATWRSRESTWNASRSRHTGMRGS